MCKIKLYESHTPVLLAGGMGTRLRSVLEEIPKPIARVKGKPFISILLTQLEKKVLTLQLFLQDIKKTT